MTIGAFLQQVRRCQSERVQPYTHVKMHGDDVAELLQSFDLPELTSVGEVRVCGYVIQSSEAVAVGQMVFHAPGCAGTYRVAA